MLNTVVAGLDVAPYLGVPPELLTDVALGGLVLAGVAMCFFGYPLLRVALGLGGFACGAAVAAYLAWRHTAPPGVVEAVTRYPEIAEEVLAALDETVVLVWAVCGGIAGAVLSVLLEQVGIFVVGGLLGVLLANATMTRLEMDIYLISVAILALIGGVLALLLRRTVIILSTSYNGAGALMFGIYALLKGFAPAEAFGELRAFNHDAYVLLGCVVILGSIGAFVQFSVLPGPEAEKGK